MKENNGGKMTDDELDELSTFWWGSDTDERTVTEVIECGSMAAFARYVLENFANRNNDKLFEIRPGLPLQFYPIHS